MYDFDFSNFCPYVFAKGRVYLSVTKNGVTFNKYVTEFLQHPKYISILINHENKQIALLPADQKSNTTYRYPQNKNVECARISPACLVDDLCKLAHINPSPGFRVYGEKKDGFILFDLSSAKALNRKVRQ